MSEGLITRIGQWMDRKWEAKATEGQIQEMQRLFNERIANLNAAISQIIVGADQKELADLKTRIEKMELYTGMTRKVDTAKPTVAKTAFQM